MPQPSPPAGPSRWVHRPPIDWTKVEQRHNPQSVEGQIYSRLHRLIAARKTHPGFAGNRMDVINVGSDHVFAFVRTHEQQRIVVLANFTEYEQQIAANEIRLYGLGYGFTDLITNQPLHLADSPIRLEPYQVLWLAAA